VSRAVAGGFLIGVPVLFNVGFGLLAQRFDYPDVLRRPTHEVLSRFRAGGSSLIVIWWMFGLSVVLFAPLAVLLAGELADADGTLVALSVLTGVLAALVQVLGLIRWPFLVPYWRERPSRLTPTQLEERRSTSSFSRCTVTSASPSASTSARRSPEPGRS
jgi:Domain of unknown function (DUF4386)